MSFPSRKGIRTKRQLPVRPALFPARDSACSRRNEIRLLAFRPTRRLPNRSREKWLIDDSVAPAPKGRKRGITAARPRPILTDFRLSHSCSADKELPPS